MSEKRTSKGSIFGALLAIALLLLAAYVGSYVALVQRVDFGDSMPHYIVLYRLGGEWSSRFFSPLHALDRKVRPAYWSHASELRREADPSL